MGCDFITLAAKGVQDLHPYLPGKPSDELERELGLSKVVKLASNENPLGVPKSALAAIENSAANLALYPDSGGYHLKQALSKKFGLDTAQITLGNGSNDVLELIARAYLQPGDEAIYSEYSFIVYQLVTQAVGAKAIVTPALNWGNDLDVMLSSITDKTRVIFLANPNNPTGTWVTKEPLTSFLDQVPEDVLVVLDEAYTEYVEQADFPDGLSLLTLYGSLVVTRTFSKAYGLAGLRVGYAASNADVANILSRVRQPFNVNSLALVAAEAALNDDAYIKNSVELNRQGLALYEQTLEKMSLSFIPSVGNFITVDFGRDADVIYQRLLQKGVITRPIANYGMPNHLRISIGTPEENEYCLDMLAEVLGDL